MARRWLLVFAALARADECAPRAPAGPARFAVAVSGDVRSLLLTLWSWDQFLLRPNRGSLDLFFHLWVDRTRAVHCATLRAQMRLPP